VEVEKAIREKIAFFDIPLREKKLYCIDQRINDNGVLIDVQLVENAIRIGANNRERLLAEAIELTGLDNPNSVKQLASWIEDETGDLPKSMDKTAVSDLIESTDSEKIINVMKLRQELSKTSVKKYDSMLEVKARNDRAYGLFQFYGANRTGRWAGRLIQVQNLPQNHIEDLDFARELVRKGDGDNFEAMFGSVPDTLSQLIRTAFVPEVLTSFIVADYSAIEARVVAWLAGEKWRLDVFNSHGKIYEAAAAAMFKVPIDSIKKGSLLRQKGKIAELACGYGGRINALKAWGADKMGLSDTELEDIIDDWRAANPAIVKLWSSVNSAAIKAITYKTTCRVNKGIDIRYTPHGLYIDLPSGRSLAYWNPRIGKNKFGSPAMIYDGMNQLSKKWETYDTYGGKLVENITQGIARDILGEAMMRFNGGGAYKIVMHVHDELIFEFDQKYAEQWVDQICKIMSLEVSWAKGLPLRAEGFVSKYYKKE
jgi:DNA polymerase